MARLLCVVPLAIVSLLVMCQLETAHSQPLWFDQLLEPFNERPYYPSAYQRPSSYQRPRQQASRQLGGKERYKKLCRVISGGDNYAFPGSIPYPSSPFCPY